MCVSGAFNNGQCAKGRRKHSPALKTWCLFSIQSSWFVFPAGRPEIIFKLIFYGKFSCTAKISQAKEALRELTLTSLTSLWSGWCHGCNRFWKYRSGQYKGITKRTIATEVYVEVNKQYLKPSHTCTCTK